MKNTLIFLRANPKSHIIILARYGIPRNRWAFHYSNEDGSFEEDLNYIEIKKLPQPFPKDHFIYKKDYTYLLNRIPDHINDVRYNLLPQHFPKRHLPVDHFVRQLNFNDWDEIMHGNQWPDMDLDYQLADPMESNHYIQRPGPLGGVGMFVLYVVIFMIGINKYFNFSLAYLGIRII